MSWEDDHDLGVDKDLEEGGRDLFQYNTVVFFLDTQEYHEKPLSG